VLARAEEELGFNLFDRVKGKLVPTPEANGLFSHALAVYDSVDRLRHVAENLRTAEQGGIRIAATPAFGIDLLPRAIASYRQEHDRIVFRVETLHHDEICRALLESRIDFGLAFEPILPAGVVGEFIARGNFVALTPSGMDFGSKRALGIEDLAVHPFIKLDGRGPLGRLLSNYMESGTVEIKPVAYAETYHVAKSLVSHGMGVTIIDNITALSGNDDRVRVWPLDPPLNFRVSILRVDKTRLSIVCRNFVSHLQTQIVKFLGQSERQPAGRRKTG